MKKDKMNFDGNTPQNRESELSECQGESFGSRFAKRKGTDLKDSGIPWIGEIPRDWKIAKLKHYTILNNGNSLNDSQKVLYSQENSENLPYISTKDVERDYDKINYHNGLSIPKNEQGFIIAPKDSILLCIEGGSAGKKIGYTKMNVFFVNKLCCISSFSEKINTRFIYYFTNSYSFSEPFFQNIQGLIGGVSVSVLKNFLFTLPPLHEQKAIADFLDRKCGEIDELVALQYKMIEELKAYKQSIITETVTKGLNPNVPLKDSGIEWIGKIPQHWENIRLKEGFRLRTGTTPKDFEKGLDSDSLINWFTPSDVAEMNCELNQSERHLSRIVINKEGILLNPIGTLIFVGIGASAGKIGYSLIESYSNQQITNLIPNEDKIVGKYIYYYLLADRKRIRDNAFFTTLPIINNSYLSSIRILTPPLSEQQEIADFLDKKCSEIDSLIELKQQKIEELKDYKKSIIYEYVTGKKQVKNQ